MRREGVLQGQSAEQPSGGQFNRIIENLIENLFEISVLENLIEKYFLVPTSRNFFSIILLN